MMQMPTSISGLTDVEMVEFTALANVWQTKTARNALRMKYYLGHNSLKDLGISIPPSLTKTETVIGWPAKGVDMLAARSMFDGFVTEGKLEDPLNLRPILQANQFDAAYEQAVTSELIHCSAFWTVTRGDTSIGEPEILISMRSAEFAAALWDFRKRQIRSGLAIVDVTIDYPHDPTMITLYLADWVITCARDVSNQWRVTDRQENPLGRPLMEPMAFLPDARRPFGRSRISREVMSITDSAQRAALRSEILMEANTAPQKALLGADEDAVKPGDWKAYLTSMMAFETNEDGEKPTLMQLPQLSPQGAVLYMQHLATRFAGATGVPVSSLGVVTDNPSSAEAIFAAKDDLVTLAQSLNRGNRISLVNVARMSVALRDGLTLDNLPPEAQALQARFRNPAMPSVVSQSDAMVKQISAIPWIGETTVALEELGYREDQIIRMLSDKRRAESAGLLQALMQTKKQELAQISTTKAQPDAAVIASDTPAE